MKGQESEQAAERVRRLRHKYVLQELQQTCWIWKRACVGEVYYQQLRLRSVEGQDLNSIGSRLLAGFFRSSPLGFPAFPLSLVLS